MYKYNSVNDEKISLHDCRANKIEFKDGVLSFFFPEGFWIIPSHPQNESENTVLTGPSQVDFEIGDIDSCEVNIFRHIRKTLIYIKKDRDIRKFIDDVNSGRYEVEFITEYKTFSSTLFRCWVWMKKRPYHRECEIELHDNAKTTYRWDEIRYDHYW